MTLETSIPRWSPAFLALFGVWLRTIFRVNFTDILFGNDRRDFGGRTVVVVANHTSWWDGFLIYLLRRRIGSTAPIYTVMLEKELAKHSWLRRIGCVGIVQGNAASTLRTFNAIADACETNPGSWVLFFPQGKISPSWSRPLRFERGVELLLRVLHENGRSRVGLSRGVTLLPVALHIEPLAAARPTAFVLAGKAVSADELLEAGAIEQLVQNVLDQLLGHVSTQGEQAADRWITFVSNQNIELNGERHGA